MIEANTYQVDHTECVDAGFCIVCWKWLAVGDDMWTVTPLTVENVGSHGDQEQVQAGPTMSVCSEDCAESYEVEHTLEVGCRTTV
jgi:hypothetical protein